MRAFAALLFIMGLTLLLERPVSGCPPSIGPHTRCQLPFTVDGITLEMTAADVRASLGPPARRGARDADEDIWYCSDTTVRFYRTSLVSVRGRTLTQDGHTLSAGDSKADALRLLGRNDDERGLLYTNGDRRNLDNEDGVISIRVSFAENDRVESCALIRGRVWHRGYWMQSPLAPRVD